MTINYAVLNPAGNITILVTTPVKETDRRFVASKIMKVEPSAEQVGFIEGNNLNMAGGEFCGNAVRCTSFYLNLSEVVCTGKTIKCEGTAAYIPNDIEGIDHFIFEEMIDNPEEKIKEEAKGRAIGYMFFNEKESSLKPLVHVPNIDYLLWEQSCASGTAALGKYLVEKYNKEIDLDVKEPGGVLHITGRPGDGYIKLDGDIILEKEGSICIQELNY